MLEATHASYQFHPATALVWSALSSDFQKKLSAYNLVTMLDAALHGQMSPNQSYRLRLEMPKVLKVINIYQTVTVTAVACDRHGNIYGKEVFNIAPSDLDSRIWVEDLVDPDIVCLDFDVNGVDREISLVDPTGLDQFTHKADAN